MADVTLGKAYVQIIPSARGISSGIKNELGGVESAGTSIGRGFGKNMLSAIAGLGIGAAVVSGFSAALGEGGKLQQSYGGLETIYEDAADAAKAYAEQAAQAGISANDYAEQAVSFGASLKQAFGGDSAAAVEAANMAIMDMTDNAAKMGTPLESIQNAYQGFAKNNYTMLDNLKLGYGGTKEEMERLLADAQELTGVEYNIDNLGDVYEAIHVIQGELGLTGVAADEASNTFSGSFAAMQASASNFLGAIALGQGVEQAMSGLIQSVITFVGNNLLPMIGTIIQSIPGALMSAVQTIAPMVMESGASFLHDFITGITVTFPEMFDSLGAAITEALPVIFDKGIEFINAVVDGIIENLPGLADAAVDIIDSIGSFLAQNFPTIAAKGAQLIVALAQGLIRSLPDILASIGKIGAAILDNVIKLAPSLLQAGVTLITNLASGLGGSVVSLVKSAMQKIANAITAPINAAKNTIRSIINRIKGLFPISIGRIVSNLKLPHFNWHWKEIIAGIKIPIFDAPSWYAKAMDTPYMFDKPTIFGAGEAGDEIMYGKANLMKDITTAVNSGRSGAAEVTNYITVNGAEDPEQWASKFARQMKLEMRMA